MVCFILTRIIRQVQFQKVVEVHSIIIIYGELHILLIVGWSYKSSICYVTSYTNSSNWLNITYDVYQGVSKTNYSKGTTQYSDVTSTSSSAYPSNGASGSYWYVYKGVY